MLTPIEILQLLQESKFNVQVDEQVNEVLLNSMQSYFPHLFELTYEKGLHYIDYSRCINAKANILTELLQQQKVFHCSSNYAECNFRPDFIYCEESIKGKLNLIEIKCRLGQTPYRDFEIKDWLDKYDINSLNNRSLRLDYSNLIDCMSEEHLANLKTRLNQEFKFELDNKKLIVDFNKNNFNIRGFDKINKAVSVLKTFK